MADFEVAKKKVPALLLPVRAAPAQETSALTLSWIFTTQPLVDSASWQAVEFDDAAWSRGAQPVRSPESVHVRSVAFPATRAHTVTLFAYPIAVPR